MSGIDLTSTTSGAQESKSFLSGIDVQTAPVNVGDSSYDELIPANVANMTIGVFMDGTSNNSNNTKARKAYQERDKSKSLSTEAQVYKDTVDTIEKDLRGSYENDFTNVARMELAYQKIEKGKQLQDKVYIEGAGTANYSADDEDGLGKGEGKTGIKEKAEKACVEISKSIKKLYKKNDLKKINILQIDVFGFSRGAAAARHFVYKINKRKGDKKGTNSRGRPIYWTSNWGDLGTKLSTSGIEVQILVIRFAGLYDTVASYGINHTGGFGVDNDSVQLNLNSIGKARHVFHLVAQDEHRENFTLTNIKSAGSKGKTIFIPGVHSDIGGSYTDNYEEKKLIIYEDFLSNIKKLRIQLIAQGWYTSSELSVYSGFDSTYLLVNKTIKSKKYSYIPLHIMVEYAIEKQVKFDLPTISGKYKLNDSRKCVLPNGEVYLTSLKLIKARLDKYIKGTEERMRMSNTSDEKMLRLIRENYIHTSAHYNDKVIGNTYPPHKPYDSYFTRKRKADLNG